MGDWFSGEFVPFDHHGKRIDFIYCTDEILEGETCRDGLRSSSLDKAFRTTAARSEVSGTEKRKNMLPHPDIPAVTTTDIFRYLKF